jgi:hypothetical protein
MSVSFVEESWPQFTKPRTPQNKREGKTGGNNPQDQVAFRTICFRPKHSAQFTRGRSPDSQVVATPACLPIPKNSGLLRRPLAAYSGGTVRDFHPLPFSLASTGEHLKEFSNYHMALARSTRNYSDRFPCVVAVLKRFG